MKIIDGDIETTIDIMLSQLGMKEAKDVKNYIQYAILYGYDNDYLYCSSEEIFAMLSTHFDIDKEYIKRKVSNTLRWVKKQRTTMFRQIIVVEQITPFICMFINSCMLYLKETYSDELDT